MSTKPINLRTRRKQLARDRKRALSDTNAARSSISARDRQQAERLVSLEVRRLDAHRLTQEAALSDENHNDD